MLKKATTLVAVLVLLTLLATPLVLAQQQDTSQDRTADQGQQATLPTLDNPFSLDTDGNLVTDCDVAFSNFARLELVRDQLSRDPQFQAELARAQNLAQVCIDEGIKPNGGVGSNDPNSSAFNQYQPQR